MVTANVEALRPLVDMLPDSNGRSPEDVQISRLLSDNAFLRVRASEWLKKNGNSLTASKLEDILVRNGLPKGVKRDVAHVLIDLSFKNLDFSKSTKDKLNRMSAIASAIRLR